MNRFNIMIYSISFIFLLTMPLAAQEMDLSPRVADGRLVVDAYLDATAERLENVRVFGWEFGEIVENPFALGDPGFNALAGVSGLPPTSRVGIQVLADLLYWDGSEDVSFDTVPDQETIDLSFLGSVRTVGTGTGALPDLFFGPAVSASGEFHVHLNTLLKGADGNIDPASVDGVEATLGMYLVQASLISNNSAIADSLPIFLLFNNGLDEPQVDLAKNFVESQLVPEPQACVLLMTLAGICSVRSRGWYCVR